MKPTIRRRHQRCSRGWTMDSWWELTVNSKRHEFISWEAAMTFLDRWYRNGWVKR